MFEKQFKQLEELFRPNVHVHYFHLSLISYDRKASSRNALPKLCLYYTLII